MAEGTRYISEVGEQFQSLHEDWISATRRQKLFTERPFCKDTFVQKEIADSIGWSLDGTS
jgi:hypothetical protein